MTNIDVVFGRRTTSMIVVVLLFCGNLVIVVNSFQATPLLQPRSASTSTTTSIPSSLSIGTTRTRVSTKLLLQHHPRQEHNRRRLLLFSTSRPTGELPPIVHDIDQEQDSPETVSTTTSSSSNTNNADAAIFLTPNKSFLKLPDAENSNEELSIIDTIPTTTTTTTKATRHNRGKKRRAIEKIKRTHLSYEIESRLARILLYPVKVTVWKPLWMVMEMMIDRLDEDGTVVVNSSGTSSSSSSISKVNSTDTMAAATMTPELAVQKDVDNAPPPPQPASIEVVEEDVVISDISTTTTPDVAIQKEDADDTPPPQSTSIEEVLVEDEVVEEDVVVVATLPQGDRWCIGAPDVDLSGKWELIITNDFKKKYDKYLERLGQPRMVRMVALSAPVIGQTFEELIQTDNGRSLLIRGKNVRGTWDRTLVASGTSCNCTDFIPLKVPIMTVDQEQVEAEAWWEDEGKVHMSWLRGVSMYGGGSFVSRRYFEEKENEDDELVYVCESSFEFNDEKKERNQLTWRFRRQG